MLKLKKLFLVLSFVIIGCVLLIVYNFQFAKNYSYASTDKSMSVSDNSDIKPRGIYTALSISLNGGDGSVWTTVRNDLTIFPSTVVVIVELYASDVYYESYLNMELVSVNNTSDLNMGKSISASSSTNGKVKYWQGRMRYKVDSGSWKEKNTGTYKCDGAGNNIGIL